MNPSNLLDRLYGDNSSKLFEQNNDMTPPSNIIQPLIKTNVKLPPLENNKVKEEKTFDNTFILELIANKPLEKNDVPDMDTVLWLYIKNLINNILPDIDYIKYFILLLRLLQIAIIIYILLGWLSPYQLLPYHIWTCILLLTMLELFDDRNIISYCIQKLTDSDTYPRLVQADINFCKLVVITVLAASLYSEIFPETSFYNVTQNIFDELAVYN